MSVALRALAALAALTLLVAGGYLAWLTVFALRRGEGVFLPIGYVAAACLAGGVLLARIVLR